MRPLSLLFLLLVAPALVAGQTSPTVQPVIAVQGPTVIAFFPFLSEADMKDGSGETLNDFQYYTGQAKGPLEAAGVTCQLTYAPSFQVRMGAKLLTFTPERKAPLGYYFVAPGRKALVKFGVMSDQEILEAARAYFGLAIK